jgi:hypothetical protein
MAVLALRMPNLPKPAPRSMAEFRKSEFQRQLEGGK